MLSRIPRDVLDTVNSVSWFLMDACWMLGIAPVSYAFILPTFLSGVALMLSDRRRPVFFINLAVNCWILMNVLWMLSENLELASALSAARLFFLGGLLSIGFAIRYSESVAETFSHFRRFRLARWAR